MQQFFNNHWILPVLIALICMLTVPLNTLYASEQSGSSSAHSLQATDSEQQAATIENQNSPPITPRRKLSSFFKLGIAINIAMMLTFFWWARRQWRMTTKNKDT